VRTVRPTTALAISVVVGMLSGGGVYGGVSWSRHDNQAQCKRILASESKIVKEAKSLMDQRAYLDQYKSKALWAANLILQNKSCFGPEDIAAAQAIHDRVMQPPPQTQSTANPFG
jgi:hypothetical protein